MLSELRSFLPPEEGVRRQQSDTEAVMSGEKLGKGTLYIAESRLSWLNDSGVGFFLEYPTISLHAISRDTAAYPEEHLYVMVNAKLGENAEKETEMKEDEEESEEEDDDDEQPITEIRFVPENKADLGEMFTAMCDCQALHPDPEDQDSEDDEDFEGEEYDVEAHERAHGDIPSFYTYEEGLSHLTAEGQATLERLEGMLADSVGNRHTMAGVRTEGSALENEDGMEVEALPSVAGQFEDADVDH
ncbi:methylosome subunit pICln [Hyperolius riggenbachi]|uniref:methylosome subunit pICln n=1 Tax=Hyperolius riggenbachi TaxID=752182 RepID=UPI0035A29C2B